MVTTSSRALDMPGRTRNPSSKGVRQATGGLDGEPLVDSLAINTKSIPMSSPLAVVLDLWLSVLSAGMARWA